MLCEGVCECEWSRAGGQGQGEIVCCVWVGILLWKEVPEKVCVFELFGDGEMILNGDLKVIGTFISVNVRRCGSDEEARRIDEL